MRKPAFLAGIAIAATVAVVAVLAVWLLAKNDVTARLGTADFALRLADTDAERQKGLSGVTYLPPNRGMLFVFDQDDRWSIWMNDMRINIDIVWLDADKRVVWVAENISPDTFPDKFTPAANARYVVELPAGAVQRAHIAVGGQTTFTLP